MRKYTGNTRKEELDKVTASYRRLRDLSYLLIALAVAALIFALVKYFAVSVIFLIAVTVLRVTVHKKARTGHQQAITDAALACSVGSRLDGFELRTKGGIGLTGDDIRAAQLLPVREGSESFILLFQGIAGPLRDMTISLNDAALHQYQHAGRKGNSVLCGVWMRFILSDDTGYDLRLMSGDFLPDDLREEFYEGLPRLVMQDAQACRLPESLLLYAASGSAPLPASFVSAVSTLCQKRYGAFGLSVRGREAHFFFRDRVLAPNYNLSAKPDEKLISADPIPEFRDALSIARTL